MGLCHASSTTGVSAARLSGESTVAPEKPGAGPGTQEEAEGNPAQAGQYDWQPDEEAAVCQRCLQTKFTLLERRHHCRSCGRVVCGDCSNRKEVVQHKAVRVCHICAENLQNIRLPPDSRDSDSEEEEEKESSPSLRQFGLID
ncbi:PREDICTED: pleckstrin homology domain-containing family F member 2-like [Branchiostoma belcheri]|uniref:Pleckstrin homology domain-containing family F member 2-like n=1 Tax=Branchiostoma belcheri TaxID=7741 RepID=A0A6P4Z9S0_BRABE|nr:PREDICTED: pleckstrin homology domain-containing family F member 2-like [Branchiostoma belcheri]